MSNFKIIPSVKRSVFPTLLLCAACALLTVIPAAGAAHAAQPRQETALRQAACNPHPDTGDIVLPMPGGLSMAFRVVAVPAFNFSRDLAFFAGLNRKTDSASQDGRHETRISAPFTGQDLPSAWVADLDTEQYRFYLIAKYEVSRLQWRAVMEKDCTISAVTGDDLLPVTGISWFEAQAFTERYTSWLLNTHPGALPSFKGDTRNTGFVRLPTESEWEYAARGGNAVSVRSLSTDAFFPLQDGKALSDYAVYQRTQDTPEKIGSRLPNPLGLYDTAGNAAEMTLDCFRLPKDGKLLGAAGGFVRKGGSFRSNLAGIMPGSREEAAFFTRDGALRQADLGLRPVISAINTPDGGRVQQAVDAYRKRERAGDAPSLSHAAPPPADEAPFLKMLAENTGQRKDDTSVFDQPFWTDRIGEGRLADSSTERITDRMVVWLYVHTVMTDLDCLCAYVLTLRTVTSSEFGPIIDSNKELSALNEKEYIEVVEEYKLILHFLLSMDQTLVREAMSGVSGGHIERNPLDKTLAWKPALFTKHYDMVRKNMELTPNMIFQDVLKEVLRTALQDAGAPAR